MIKLAEPRPIVIYHRSDFDGIFCREIAKKAMPNAELIGWDYGDPVPQVSRHAPLYMLDISVEGLMDHPRLIWIDHHKSAIEKYQHRVKPAFPGLQIDGVAACRLAWQYFFREDPNTPTADDFVNRAVTEPWAVRLAGEYDVWDRRDPDAEVFQFGLKSTTGLDWEWLLSLIPRNVYVSELLTRGQMLKDYQDRQNAEIIQSNAFAIEWEGLCFLCCNHARFNSHLFDALANPIRHDALLGFRYDGSKCKWVVSLYHCPGKEHLDLSVIAVKHGGGGHRGACGFTCDELPFSLP